MLPALIHRVAFASLCLCLLSAQAVTQAPWFEYDLVAIQKRAPAFTQGLELYQGDLIHSSGLVGQSFIERLPHPDNSQTEPHWRLGLSAPIFAEGSSVFKGNVYLLSWRHNTGWRLNPKTGQVLDQFRYQGQGWGLTHNDTHLIRSDGSEHLYFHRAPDFELDSTLTVSRNGQPLRKLNELEFAEGYIWANIWQTNTIVAIAPTTGEVVGQLDVSRLVPKEAYKDPDNVLNGIAYDASTGHYWLTGKRWQHWYRIDINLPEVK
ncbi:glutaminyl-peptide cyclotransferase [Gilvimarinus sp. 1_MG-2023]|uniref:glutaminyl-peptide cyclotransferase n=1 Tax=Gilvimarinus sp. 1_MG-2023 TaxID=3062638 RepID=UPI0026E38E5F|nr:glutaminyl-peptide cyclotransferase [Gilvimarinus sp. 1_MG-2023]MDO6747374.1 glutaminyl-peptide cyclotransferase [Gilvimarinus sp. 1_MG-2023]